MMKIKSFKLNLVWIALICSVSLVAVGCKKDEKKDPVPTPTVTHTFTKDVLPLFTTADAFVKGGAACDSCHFGIDAGSAHEMDMTSYAGIIAGADSLEAPPGVSLLGQATVGDPATVAPDWGKSKMKERLRNNRMPAMTWTAANIANRDTLAGDMVAAWVTAGATDATFDATFNVKTVLNLFNTDNAFFDGGAACSSCHFGIDAGSAHEMDMSTYAGIIAGADSLEAPPGVSILGQASVGDPATVAVNWGKSKMKERLRNNRMPPGAWTAANMSNRDTLQGGVIESWIEAGAPDTGTTFTCTAAQGCTATLAGAVGGDTSDDIATTYDYSDVQTLFSSADAVVVGGAACDSCHFGISASSAHEMDLSTYAGVLAGADSLEAPPGVSILGQSEPTTDVVSFPPNWGTSKMKGRLRNNRMPAMDWTTADIANRDSMAGDMVAAWVTAGAPNGDFTVSLDFTNDILPLFTTADAFFKGGAACSSCHSGVSASSAHEMGMATYADIIAGADSLEAPPGVSILGQAAVGNPATEPVDWAKSKLKGRLRNNRMPPGAWNPSDATNRDTTEIKIVGDWITAGAPDGAFDCPSCP
ncbi:MAG: hypothetical protein OEY59_12540 [Deltaproteobacteria bacterium]|nr:hypothetical protein [Deltaproteobacteria bacterium]